MTAPGFQQGRRTVNRVIDAQAPAKVNLHLEVLRLRHDGYHEVETVLQAVTLYDRLTVALKDEFAGGEPRLRLTVSGRGTVPADETNLCWRAARHFCRATGRSGEISVDLHKEIPAAAGLGGGSSDAAGVLAALDRLFGTQMEPPQLEAMAEPLGADVPFFIRGGTALGRGTGTRLTTLPTLRSGCFLIVHSGLELKTAEVYADLKMGLTVNPPTANIKVIKPMLARFPQRTWPGFNRLEEAVLPQQPSLQRTVLRLRQLAPVAMMSGSGSAVVAIFADGTDVSDLVGEFEEAGMFVRVVGPHAAGVSLTEAGTPRS